MKYQITRSRRQVEQMTVEASTAASALNKAEAFAEPNGRWSSILDSDGHWSYDVTPRP